MEAGNVRAWGVSMGAAKEPKEDLWFIPGAGHTEGTEVAPQEYGKRVVDFFNRYLEP